MAHTISRTKSGESAAIFLMHICANVMIGLIGVITYLLDRQLRKWEQDAPA
jgi:hypothetical protein